ncbi:Clavaminate synthase-like protein [Aspergillus phoenicis ATCC 13157]|uniref:Clavaminate synthase-like protein n=1 Tax=Aspergillus phoenicis ATCC 13157 TaxID=1353007 RepID=A0A370PVG5_ASPPH|nr:Clavaminate synthase-like protein [Aspergillus phoenicis ATCC 13157]
MSPAIPVIDFRPREDRQRLTDEIHHTCEDLGFFQLRNYTIPVELQTAILEQSKDFFCLPVEIKEKYDRGKLASNIHTAQKLEKRTTGDLKEGFSLGRHLPLDRRPRPPDASELERGVHYQSSRIRLPTTNELTLLAGIGAHSDFGAITILLQDSVGGSTDFLVECLESCLEPGRYLWGCHQNPNIPTIARTDHRDLGELFHRDMEGKQWIDSKRHAASAGSTRTTLKMNPDCSCGLPSAQGRF